MRFLKKLFSGAEPSEPPLVKQAVGTTQEFALAIMRPKDAQAFLADELRRQVLCAYCFGAVHVLAQQHKLALPEAHAVAIAFLHQHMGYSPEASAQQAHQLIMAASDPDQRNTHKAIIHRGIDAFLAWQRAPASFTTADFRDVLSHLQKAGAA